MPRTKGSKNKPKVVNDFASQIAEKQSIIESLNTEIASITANIDSLKADLKAKRAALKSAEKEAGKLEAKKAKEDQKAAEEAKKAEAESVLKKLLADGMSAEEILAKLNNIKAHSGQVRTCLLWAFSVKIIFTQHQTGNTVAA